MTHRVFLDANVLFSAAYAWHRGHSHRSADDDDPPG